MKNLKFTFLFFALAMFLMAPSAEAVHPVKTQETTVSDSKVKSPITAKKLTKRELRKQKRWTKRLNRFAKKIAKKGIDLSDPVNKWGWLALGAILGGLLLIVLATALFTSAGFGLGYIFWLLSMLLLLAGTVFGVIWLVKMFA